MSQRLEAAVLKIKRADEHMAALHEAIGRLGVGVADVVTRELDANTGEHVLFAPDTIPAPSPEIGVLCGDILHNLRSALDHLAFQLVSEPYRRSRDRQRKTSEDNIAFPICSKYQYWNGTKKTPGAKERIRGTAPGAKAIIRLHQPFHRAGARKGAQAHPLWLLHKLHNWDKHRLLNLVSHKVTACGFFEEALVECAQFIRPGPLEGGAELARYRLKAGVDPEMDVGFYIVRDVTFDQAPSVARGLSLVPTLEAIRNRVAMITSALTPFVA